MEVQNWVIERISAIHDERQNRWQKLVGMLIGRSGEPGEPGAESKTVANGTAADDTVVR
jgi:hypothetical protein